MEDPRGTAHLAAELRAAQDALAAFDATSLRTDDGAYDAHALYRRGQLLAAVESAHARLAAAQAPGSAPPTP